MSIRESIEKKKGVAAVISIVVLALTVFYISRNLFSSPPTNSNGAYFTIDDGRTRFVESMDHLPPFDRDGKPASRAWVYSSDGGKTTFVAYLERYTPSAKQRMEAQLADFNAGKSRVPPTAGPADTEVKKPGEGNPWVNRSDYPQSTKITAIPSAGGTVTEVVLP